MCASVIVIDLEKATLMVTGSARRPKMPVLPFSCVVEVDFLNEHGGTYFQAAVP